MNDFPCTCGHDKNEHRLDFPKGSQGCTIYLEKYIWCGCYNYVPDNLKYLEQKYEKRLK
jgi:hypothetical protein